MVSQELSRLRGLRVPTFRTIPMSRDVVRTSENAQSLEKDQLSRCREFGHNQVAKIVRHGIATPCVWYDHGSTTWECVPFPTARVILKNATVDVPVISWDAVTSVEEYIHVLQMFLHRVATEETVEVGAWWHEGRIHQDPLPYTLATVDILQESLEQNIIGAQSHAQRF